MSVPDVQIATRSGLPAGLHTLSTGRSQTFGGKTS